MAIPEGFEVVSSSIPEGFEAVEPEATQPEPAQPDSFGDDALDVLGEFAAGANRSVTEFVDFLGPDTANAILSLAGSESRVPRLSDNIPGIQGGFMEEGLARDVVGATGGAIPAAAGIGSAIRSVAKPATTAISGQIQAGSKELANLAAPQSLGKSIAAASSATPAADIGYGAVSAAGAEVGEEVGGDTGSLIGSILAPLSVASGTQGLKAIFGKGAEGVKSLTTSLSSMSDDGAGQLLAEAMARENMSPDDVVKAMASLGPEGLQLI